jgi:hypothetical protein
MFTMAYVGRWYGIDTGNPVERMLSPCKNLYAGRETGTIRGTGDTPAPDGILAPALSLGAKTWARC